MQSPQAVHVDVENGNSSDHIDTERHIFRFFDLPREMRDTIYGFIQSITSIVNLRCRLRLEADTKPKSLLLVSKQFRKEYEEVVTKSAKHLEITDYDTNGDYEGEWILPSAAGKSTHIHINLVCEANPDSYVDFELMRAWISMVLFQLRSIQVLTMRLDIDPEIGPDDIQDIEAQLQHLFWKVMPCLESFKVYKSDITWWSNRYSADRQLKDENLLLELLGESKQIKKFY